MLQVGLGSGGGAGMGHNDVAIQFTNTTENSCFLVGWPGVSYNLGPANHDATGATGELIGAPADRVATKGPAVTLAPGRMAYAEVQMPLDAAAQNDDPSVPCNLSPTSGLRVFPPDETISVYVAYDSQACSNPAIHSLSVQTIKAGSGQ
jgi:hypothetical protein